MNTSFCMGDFAYNDMESAIKKISQLGYDGIELWDQYLSKVDLKWMRNVMESNRISVAQICPYFNFTGTKREWEESISIAKRYVEIAQILNTDLIRTFTGNVGSKEATKEQWQAGVEGLQTICKIGKEKGIRFALETHQGSLMDTSDSTLRLLKEVNMDNLGVNLQVPLKDENIITSAKKLGCYTFHIHAHNWIGSDEDCNPKELTYLDSGEIDFEGFITCLYKEGFDGYISIEHATHQNKRDPYQVAEHEIKYLRNLISRISKSNHVAK